MPRKKSILKHVKESIAVIAAFVLIFGGIWGGITYFTTKEEFRNFECHMKTKLQLLNSNDKLLTSELEIFSSKVTREYLMRTKNEETTLNIQQINDLIEKAKTDRTIIKEEISELELKLSNPDCN